MTGRAGPDPAVAQAVEEEGAGQPVLEAAGGVGRLVLEVQVDAPLLGQREAQQVGVGRAVGVGLDLADGFFEPVAVGRRRCGRRRGSRRRSGSAGGCSRRGSLRCRADGASRGRHLDHRHLPHASHLHKHTFEQPKGAPGAGRGQSVGAHSGECSGRPVPRCRAHWCSTPRAGRLHRQRGRTLDHDSWTWPTRITVGTDAHKGAGRHGGAGVHGHGRADRASGCARSPGPDRSGSATAGWSCSPATAREIDSAPVQAVRASQAAGSPREDRALADLNGNRYLLTLGDHDPRPGRAGAARGAPVHRGRAQGRGARG